MSSIKNIRDYEVSIWTLQDSFIAILKQSNLENKEKIQDPKMILKDDGENTFSFKIPMYLREDSDISNEIFWDDKVKWRENPIWYTVRNGNFIVGMRKIKVIYNKKTDDEKVFEFIITNIKEEHSGFEKYCEVSCEGLAFHELGRQGYNISLSYDNFLADYEDWQKNPITPEPINNLDYWVNKVLEGSNWNYVVNMDWSNYDGIPNRGNLLTSDSSKASSTIVYDPEKENDPTIQGNFSDIFHIKSENKDDFKLDMLITVSYDYKVNKLSSASENAFLYTQLKGWRLTPVIDQKAFHNKPVGHVRESFRVNSNQVNSQNNYVRFRLYGAKKEDSITISNVRVIIGDRENDKVYQEPYVSSWKIVGVNNEKELKRDTLVTDITKLEKRAFVEKEESNRYNLLQAIAEAFQVFCKFEYLYDDDYHIIGRRVIFYNNFINEAESVEDFTYGYDTHQLSREMDNLDLVSKMYVKSFKDDSLYLGEINLSDTAVNPSLENYLLNFDYLYNIGTITQEQYSAIEKFECEVHEKNEELLEKTSELIRYNNQLPEKEAKKEYLEDLIKEANQRLTESAGYNEVGTIKYKDNSSCLFTVLHSAKNVGEYYITINKKYGKIISPFNLYSVKNSQTNSVEPNSLISDLYFEYDENNIITKVILPSSIGDNVSTVYGVFECDPDGPRKIIAQIWGTKQVHSEEEKEAVEAEITQLKENIESCESELKELREQKQDLITQFEKLMGPALREGTWQPDDEYSKYQIKDNFTVNNIINTVFNTVLNDSPTFFWDSELFDNEQESTYAYSLTEEKERSYPCVWLTWEELANLNLENLNFIYQDSDLSPDNNNNNDPKLSHYLPFGADNGCKFVFIKNTQRNVFYPALMLVGVKSLLDKTEEGDNWRQLYRNARLRNITYTDNGINEVEKNGIVFDVPTLENNGRWISPNSMEDHWEVVYPRFRASTKNFIYTDVSITQNSIISDVSSDNPVIQSTLLDISSGYFYIKSRGQYWYITLNPEKIINNLEDTYTLNYSLSTAAEAMYLDAVQILKENSAPKVSYSITPSVVKEGFVKTAYNRLGQLLHINDAELKFENVRGYISEVELDLDKPWEDSYTVKNYKTKFEDLFSTIVAQTEQMQKNSQVISTLADTFNKTGSLTNTVVNNVYETIDYHIPTPAEIYSQYEPMLQEKLKIIYDEGLEVLGQAQGILEELSSSIIEADSTLNESIKNTVIDFYGAKVYYTPYSYPNAEYPDESYKTLVSSNSSQYDEDTRIDKDKNIIKTFKFGDKWIRRDGIYVSTLTVTTPDPNDAKATSLNGWNKVYLDSLAAISGAKMIVDAEQNLIQMNASKIEINGNDIQITGNKGIKLGAAGGISLVSTKIEQGASLELSVVELTPSDGIVVGSSGQIRLEGSSINFLTSDKNAVNAMNLDSNGIYLGTNGSIQFYSTASLDSSESSALVKINSKEILFGVAQRNDTSAVQISQLGITLAVGVISENNGNNITTIGESTAGVTLTKDGIKMAVAGENDDLSLLSLTGDLIKIGYAVNNQDGSFVEISQTGIIIGTRGNKDRFIQSASSSVSYTGARFEVYAPNFVVDTDGHLYAYNADISGTIRASAGQIGNFIISNNNRAGNIFANSLYTTYSDNTYKYEIGIRGRPQEEDEDDKNRVFYAYRIAKNSSWHDQSGEWQGDPMFTVSREGKLYAKEATIEGSITATSFLLGSKATIPQNKVDGLETRLNNIKSINNTTITYAISNSATTIPGNNDWESSIPTATDAKPYLWTRTTTTYTGGGGGSSNAYSISYKGRDGERGATGPAGSKGDKGETGATGPAGKYITLITPLYRLNIGVITNGSKPESKVTSTADTVNDWTTIIPTYPDSRYTYYRCEQEIWSDNTIAWTDVRPDYGLTVANQTATRASIEAQEAAANIEKFDDNGLKLDFPWGNSVYKVALTSNTNLLIGSNSGLTIAKSNAASDGAAMVINKSGIALAGATINLKASSDSATSVISLSSSGIALGSTGQFTIASNNFKIDSSGNVTVKGTITATSGSIGNFNISNSNDQFSSSGNIFPNSLYTTYEDNTYRYEIGIQGSTKETSPLFYVYRTGVNQGWRNQQNNGWLGEAIFSVSKQGQLITKSGTIGQWTIGSNYIGNASTRENSTIGMSYGEGFTGDSWVFWSGGTNGRSGSKFYVTKGGKLYAEDAEIRGIIKATSLIIQSDNNNSSIDSYIDDIIGHKGYITNAALSNYATISQLSALEGEIEAKAFIIDYGTGKVISGTNLVMDANGYLSLSSISGGGNLATISLENGCINLRAGGNSYLSSSSYVKISNEAILLGTLDSTYIALNSDGTTLKGKSISLDGGNISLTGGGLYFGTGITTNFSIVNTTDLQISANYLVIKDSTSGQSYRLVIRNRDLITSNPTNPGTPNSSHGPNDMTGVLWIDPTGTTSHDGWSQVHIFYKNKG